MCVYTHLSAGLDHLFLQSHPQAQTIALSSETLDATVDNSNDSNPQNIPVSPSSMHKMVNQSAGVASRLGATAETDECSIVSWVEAANSGIALVQQ